MWLMHGDWEGLQVCLCHLQAHCEPIVLQNQHRSGHRGALVSSPASCISLFKPLRLFCCLSYGRVELIVANKHGGWMLMQGLFWFFSSREVTFQNYHVKFTPVLRGFLSNSFDVALQFARQWEEGIITSTCHILGLKSRKICPLVPHCWKVMKYKAVSWTIAWFQEWEINLATAKQMHRTGMKREEREML